MTDDLIHIVAGLCLAVVLVILLVSSYLFFTSRAVLDHRWGCAELSERGTCDAYHLIKGESQ